MMRVVRAADGRVWTLQSDMEWRTPATADDFEHDIAAGRGPAMVLLFLVTVLAVVLVVWTPPDVVVPLWLVLIILLILLFFPLRWTLRRPWTVVAATGDDGEGRPTEKWVGTVRGVFNVRQQVNRIARNIADESIPGMAGPLKPVS
ncbi:MAG: DUF983 domain-containing protein [Labedaea sp.]